MTERVWSRSGQGDGMSATPFSLISAQSSISLVLSNLLLSALFALMMWDVAPRSALQVWLVVMAVIGVVEFGARVLPFEASGGFSSGRKLAVNVLDVCVGFLWLYAAMFFFPEARPNLQFFWLFALAAPALCTAVYQHADLTACFARIGLALPVGAFHLLNSGDTLAWIQAFIVVALWVSLIWLAVRLHRSLQYRITLISNRDALLQKVADSTRDLEALRTMEAESRELAESANLAKSRFLAHSSHDLRQPLHAISLLLETVDDDELNESTGYVVARVKQSVELLAKLFDSLLDLTLLDTGQIEINADVFALDSLFHELANDFAAVAEVNEVTINVETSDLQIDADATIVRRMIQNLLANAIRYAGDGGVTLRVRRADELAYLEVEDSGVGIAAEDQKRIFEEFTKLAEPAADMSSASLGLGLAIVSRLAQLIDVEVSVTSEPNRGSLFSVGPFQIHAGREIPLAISKAPAIELNNANIVVVDDDLDTLRATGTLLEKWGLAVRLMVNGDKADETRPDILICDYELGHEETGIDVIKRVRDKAGCNVPALLISGNTSSELAALAAQEDLRLLHKPVRPAQLKSAILTLLGTAAIDSPKQRSSRGQ